MGLTALDIYLGLGGLRPHPALATISIKDFVIDSRQSRPDSCFIALAGDHTDGNLYVPDAISRQASAVIATQIPDGGPARIIRPAHDPAPRIVDTPLIFLVEDSLEALQHLSAYWRARHNPTVIGITGSVGKTSTKELMASVLQRRFNTLSNIGNLNNEIGLPLTLLRLDDSHQCAVLEMGFYEEGEIALLCDLAHPQIGVITNVGPMHLERAGSIEAIYRGKSELVKDLPPEGHAVLNWDDPWVKKMADISPAPVYRYGLTEEADLWADEIISGGLEGIRFRFNQRLATGAVDVFHVHLPLLGRHSVHTALRAAAVGLLCGLSWEDIVAGLHDVNAQIRIEVTPGYNGSTLIDDTYNASPQSTIAALNLLTEMEGRHIAILGDMLELGSYEETGHRLVGRRAADSVDVLIAVGPLSASTTEEALAAGMDPARVFHTLTTAEAKEIVTTLICPHDFVLIKGSAMGLEALVADLSMPPHDLNT